MNELEVGLETHAWSLHCQTRHKQNSTDFTFNSKSLLKENDKIADEKEEFLKRRNTLDETVAQEQTDFLFPIQSSSFKDLEL